MKRGLADHPGRFKNQRLPFIENDEKRFVTFFRDAAMNLPVKRIIVGPASGAEQRVALARKLRPDWSEPLVSSSDEQSLGDVPAFVSKCVRQ